MNNSTVKPCWCRSDTEYLRVKAHMDHGEFGCRERGRYVYCPNCWVCGPTYNTDAEAIKGWNNSRRISAPIAPVVDDEQVTPPMIVEALRMMIELWDANHPDDPCGCVGASDDCRYPPPCELCRAREALRSVTIERPRQVFDAGFSAPASTVAPQQSGDDQPAHDGFHCEQCETTFFTEPHATEDGYWLCGPCWKGLQSELKDRSCMRAFPCRYRDARQCARDTMLGSECPKVCDCACHSPASPTATALLESPILAFEAWLLRWVADNGRKLTQDEYGIAYAAFIAAHPGEGPQAHVMAASPAALRDEADILDDEAVDKELRRWQDAIRDKMIGMGVPDSKIDGAGCDSGDPLDFTLAEVGQGVGYFLDQLEELRAATTPPSTLARSEQNK